MIDENISRHVLTIGIECERPVGGVAAVLYVYKRHILRPFHFLASAGNGSQWRKWRIFARCLLRLPWTIVANDIRCVHFQAATGASFWRTVIMATIVKAMRRSIAYHMHGGDIKQFAGRHPRMVRLMVEHSDCVIALSQYWKEWFEATFHCRQVEVVPNVIEPPVRIGDKPDDGICRFVFLGLICKNKGVWDMLEAMRQDKNRFAGRIQIVIGGNGETELLCQRIKEYGLDGIVKFAGWVAGEKKARLLTGADAFVLPSYIEGVPISLLEAMSYGLPVITTGVGGIPNIVSEGVNGFMIRPGDTAAFADCLDKLASSAEMRKKMGEAGMRMCAKHLPEDAERKLKTIYMKFTPPFRYSRCPAISTNSCNPAVLALRLTA